MCNLYACMVLYSELDIVDDHWHAFLIEFEAINSLRM